MASKQKLSPIARKAKAARDLAYAKTPDRRKKKAHAQRERRRAKRSGRNVDGLDWDHKDGRWEKPSRNRANDGQGTKKEGRKKYTVPQRKRRATRKKKK
tara:strand:+ start:280 stop:576 length:297 start_codon:yes stop_codon:yes gene_type:complete